MVLIGSFFGTQYAVLGLWEAENAGVSVTPAVWDRAASWFMATQHSSGAWSYHSDEIQYQETLSMTAAHIRVIATPNDSHFELARACLLAGSSPRSFRTTRLQRVTKSH